MDMCTPFTKKEEAALRTVIALAKEGQDARQTNFDAAENLDAIGIVEAMLPDPT